MCKSWLLKSADSRLSRKVFIPSGLPYTLSLDLQDSSVATSRVMCVTTMRTEEWVAENEFQRATLGCKLHSVSEGTRHSQKPMSKAEWGSPSKCLGTAQQF